MSEAGLSKRASSGLTPSSSIPEYRFPYQQGMPVTAALSFRARLQIQPLGSINWTHGLLLAAFFPSICPAVYLPCVPKKERTVRQNLLWDQATCSPPHGTGSQIYWKLLLQHQPGLAGDTGNIPAVDPGQQ